MLKNKYKIVYEEDREYFECDCHDSDHVMRVELEKMSDADGNTFVDELSFSFRAIIGDWEANYPLGKYTTDFNYTIHEWANKFRRMKWRFKMAFRIFFHGKFEIHDQWIPERRGADQMSGAKEVSRLLLWVAQKHIQIYERQLQFGKLSPEELKEYREFADEWAMYPLSLAEIADDDKTA